MLRPTRIRTYPMKKNIFLTLICLSLSLMVGAQSRLNLGGQPIKVSTAENQQLRHFIDSINKQFPMVINPSIEMMKFAYENGNVIMVYAVDESALNLDELKKNEELIKQGLRQTIINNTSHFRKLLKILIDNKSGLGVLYHSKTSTLSAKANFTYDELVEIYDAQSASEGDYEAQLAAQIKIANLSLPRMLDEITICERVVLENKTVVYYHTIEESDEFSLNSFKTGKEKKAFANVIKLSAYSSMTNPITVKFYQLVAYTNRSLKFHYIGNQSGKEFDVVLTNKELKKVLLKP